MRTPNIFIDVDLTLIDESGNLIPGAREGLKALKDAGCKLYLWSAGGENYARAVAAKHNLTNFFDGIIAKPDIVIDDMPSSTVSPYVYRVRNEYSWELLVERIIRRHID